MNGRVHSVEFGEFVKDKKQTRKIMKEIKEFYSENDNNKKIKLENAIASLPLNILRSPVRPRNYGLNQTYKF